MEAHYRKRVERMTYGDLRVEDLASLFLFLRADAETETTREIGNFIAHSDMREPGSLSEITADFFIVMRTVIPRLTPNAPPHAFAFDNLPENFPDYLRSSLHRFDKRLLAQKTGMKRKQPDAVLDSLLAKTIARGDGKYEIRSFLLPEEWKLLDCLLSTFTIKDAFNDDRVFKEFVHELVRNKFLRREDRKLMNRTRHFIIAYTVSLMHGCRIAVNDDEIAQLYVSIGANDNLNISTRIDCPIPTIPQLRIACTFFSTSLDAKKYCDETLLNTLRLNPMPAPAVEERAIEVNSRGVLREILPRDAFQRPVFVSPPLPQYPPNSFWLRAALFLAALFRRATRHFRQ
jgi:hypothetical protein